MLTALTIGVAPGLPTAFEPPTIPVEWVQAPIPRLTPPSPEPTPSLQPAPSPAASPPRLHRPVAIPPDTQPLLVNQGPMDSPVARFSDAQVAGAATAGSGPGGGQGCDMARRLQAALRKDARTQAAVAEAVRAPATSTLFVWNGDWIRSRGQDGAGLAAVREAILWEVGFAPQACRGEPVHGLVLFSMADNPGAARLVLGADDWRWSDLLHPRAGKP